MRRLERILNENTLLLNAFYDKYTDILAVTMRDISTGQKIHYNIPKPYVPVYILKQKPDSYQEHAHLNDLDIYWVREAFRVYAIADILGLRNYREKVKNGDIPYKQVYLHKRCIGSDIKIEDLVLREYCKYFVKEQNGVKVVSPPRTNHLHIGALDIETDINISDDRAKQPINVITYIDNQSWVIRTIAVKNPNYPGQEEIIKNKKQFEKDLIALIRKNIEELRLDIDEEEERLEAEKGIRSLLMPFVDKLSLNLSFTESESSMIKNINKYVFNEVSPDYLYIYNAEYDISQQQMRCKELNINFDNLFKYKDKPPFTRFNNADKRFDVKKKMHSYDTNSATKILDQMLQYYQFRSAKNFARHSLDATAKREIGTAKLDYSKICNWIGDFPYVDYRTFLMYNIVDVLIMLFLDAVTNDTMNLVYRRFDMQTSWNNLSRSSVRTTRAFDFVPYLDGYISSNEINPLLIDIPKRKLKEMKDKNPSLYNIVNRLQEATVKKGDPNPHAIPGGLCTKPVLIDKSIREASLYGNLNVKNYSKFTYCADDDATSMYPFNIVANNASKATFYGIIEKVDGIEMESKELAPRVSMSIINQNLSSLGNLLYSLPSAEHLLEKYRNIKPDFNHHTGNKINRDDFELDPKLGNSFIKWWRSCYNTKYNNQDLETGSPTNRLFLFCDKESVEFSYYDTKVIVTTKETTSNSLIGKDGLGLSCGTIKKNIFTNLSEEYEEKLHIDNEEPEVSLLLSDGVIRDQDLKLLSDAKDIPFTLDLDILKFQTLNRVFFANFKSPIKWELWSLYKNDKCFMLRLFSSYTLKEVEVEVEQRIIVYNLNR